MFSLLEFCGSDRILAVCYQPRPYYYYLGQQQTNNTILNTFIQPLF